MKLSLPTFILAAATLQAESANARLSSYSANDGHTHSDDHAADERGEETSTSPRGLTGSVSMPVSMLKEEGLFDNTSAIKTSKSDKSREKIDVPASPPLQKLRKLFTASLSLEEQEQRQKLGQDVWWPKYGNTFDEGMCVNVGTPLHGVHAYTSKDVCCNSWFPNQSSNLCVVGDSLTTGPQGDSALAAIMEQQDTFKADIAVLKINYSTLKNDYDALKSHQDQFESCIEVNEVEGGINKIHIKEGCELIIHGEQSSGKIDVPSSPPLPGVSNSESKPKVILAQDTNYPPFTKIGTDLGLTGFGPDFAMGIEEVCNIDVTLVQTDWSECWGDNVIGNGLLSGHYHGCTTYTGTKGVRQRYLEFSAPILPMNKAAGILTRLVNGVPVVDGSNSLDGVNVGDVVGWAPTADVLAISKNLCTGDFYSGYTLIPNLPGSRNENDVALSQLLNETVDALWIYADQAASYKSACDIDNEQEWDCDLWSKFGTDFAYVQTGFYDYMESGTTLAISKKGSGLADTLNPCIEAFIKTKSYKDLCTKYDMEGDCFQNEFFNESDKEVMPYSLPTNELTTSCSDGYCPCPPYKSR